MSDRIVYPHGSGLRSGLVDVGGAPGNVYLEKLIYRLADVATAAPGTRINTHGAGEVAVFSDLPVDIQVADSPKQYQLKTEFRLRGKCPHITVTRRAAFGFGRLIVFLGDPFLGVGFDREDPRFRLAYGTSASFGNWAIAAGGLTSSNFAMPYAGTPPTNVVEAMYLKQIYIGRLVQGTISSVRIEETESGVTQSLFFEAIDVPTDQYLWDCNGFPARIPSEFQIVLTGSVEPVLTTVEDNLQMAVI